MKFTRFFCIVLFLPILLFACKEQGQPDMGVTIQPLGDQILVEADTFHVRSANWLAPYIYSSPDSFLLGNFYNEHLGTTKAEIMTQLACPIGYSFPEGVVPDSVELYLYYSSWYGDGHSPMRINVYEMDKETFQYHENYPSNLDVDKYVSGNSLLSSRVITAANAADSVLDNVSGNYLYYVRFTLPEDFTQRFFDDSHYATLEDFSEFFKGLYITTDYGTACVLNVAQLDLTLYYHFTYQKEGKDTTVYNYKNYPANEEVRRVNRILHPDRESVIKDVDSIHYIAAPAHVFTSLELPVRQMSDTINQRIDHKRPYVNAAIMRVELADVPTHEWATPPSHLMLIKESSLDRFFAQKELPSDTCAILAEMKYSVKADKYSYYYDFSIDQILMSELRKEEQMQEFIKMYLLPVTVEMKTDSYGSSSVSGVKHDQGMSMAIIRSAKNQAAPLKVSLLYCGF
ncbi:MAG: DUF4270 domain-containing protein [Paludibacteraceae bacterium]|nr:DUF4270 domain-containing protein [Paludibacteraceae bacterium]